MAEKTEPMELTGQPHNQNSRLEWNRSPKWVRVMLHGEFIADSRQVMLLRESGHIPVYYFPEADVRTDLFEPSDHTTTCPYKGEASYWHVKVDEEIAENAVWSYPEPIEGASYLAGYMAFYWDKMDAWFEEDQQVYVHPRDPYTRIDTLRSSRRVKVVNDGVVLAESDRPTLVFETGLPSRYYLPRTDVRIDLLVPSDTITRCPYKGEARYYSVKTKSHTIEDLVWYYPYPTTEVAAIQDQLCFYQEQVDEFYVD